MAVDPNQSYLEKQNKEIEKNLRKKVLFFLFIQRCPSILIWI